MITKAGSSLNKIRGKRVAVMGLGLYPKGTGVEAVKFFLRQGARKIVITDLHPRRELRTSLARIKAYQENSQFSILNSQTNPKTQTPNSKVVYILGQHRVEDFKNADIIFQNPSVPSDSPYLKIARARKIPIVNDWSIFLSTHDPKIFVGVTGTRGKSTTTALIYRMLKRKYGRVRLAGNMGVSPLSFVDSYRGEPIVAELSSWLLHHFAGVRKSPRISVVTNILRDHLNKYKSMKEYIADKENIFRFQNSNNILVANADDPIVRRMAKKARGKIVWFSLKKHLPRWVPLHRIKLLGNHNRANVLASCAAGEALRIPRRDIINVISTFRGLPNRLELVRTIKGVQYYNDTTSTTPDATIAALHTLGIRNQESGTKKIVLIAGGTDKKLDYRALANEIKKYCKTVILLPGTATEKIKSLIHDSLFMIQKAKNMQEAVRKTKNVAEKGDIALLSPAATSFGLFQNEFDRGAQFVKAVKRMGNE